MSLKSDDTLNRTTRQSMAEFGAEIERTFLAFVKDHSLTMLRYALVAVYVWFGLLTMTGTSPTAGLVAEMFPFVPTEVFRLVLGGWEVAVGLALLSRRTLRLAVILLASHAAVVMLPLAVFPAQTFSYFPYGPSFEGVYIIKDWVLLGAVMTVGGWVGNTE
ncbi:hypothetical protein HAPAU_38760 [Halalkalicoccus paucihalophilus]|uniref:DoxX n=1 Tax=Halalkalicoccus paucihalophilus TaxID=1008153 RepID=A0A151A8U0_9EURY|nr:hypothetical protein [Halalkalicoccus paucihalophilus]KYH23797.1 hypothetical protein HAPAU_38760 [Halalkalicoccus paucihalophilus]